MSYTDQITEFTPHVCTYIWVTIWVPWLYLYFCTSIFEISDIQWAKNDKGREIDALIGTVLKFGFAIIFSLFFLNFIVRLMGQWHRIKPPFVSIFFLPEVISYNYQYIIIFFSFWRIQRFKSKLYNKKIIVWFFAGYRKIKLNNRRILTNHKSCKNVMLKAEVGVFFFTKYYYYYEL